MALDYVSTTRPTALAAAMDSITTTVSLVDATTFPDPAILGNQYTIIIGYGSSREEICTVTAKPTTTTLTVVRGEDGTPAVAKNIGDTVVHGVSARDFKRFDGLEDDIADVGTGLAALDAAKYDKTGGPIAGSVTAHRVTVDDPVGTDAVVDLIGDGVRAVKSRSQAGVARWQLTLGTGAAESGGNAGSTFGLYAYSDTGTLLHASLIGDRNTGRLAVASDPTAALGIATKQYVDAQVPIGTIIMFGSGTIPVEMEPYWHLCNGSAHGSAALYSAIGSTTTPDLRGLFVVGAGQNADATTGATTDYPVGVGTKSGKEGVTLTGAQSGTPVHGHTATVSAHTHTVDPPATNTGAMSANAIHNHTAPSGYDYGFPLDSHAKNAASGSAVTGVSGFQGTTNDRDMSHTHPINIASFSTGAASPAQTVSVAAATAANASAAHENRPPYYAVTYLIKKA